MKSSLHVAVECGKEDVVWLLLWLGSGIATEAFPRGVRDVAEGLGLGRETAVGEDIRGMRDSEGATAEMVATRLQSVSQSLLESKILRTS
jgi:hypothetical protein